MINGVVLNTVREQNNDDVNNMGRRPTFVSSVIGAVIVSRLALD